MSLRTLRVFHHRYRAAISNIPSMNTAATMENMKPTTSKATAAIEESKRVSGLAA